MASEQGDNLTKSVTELQKELDAAVQRYEKLNTAHEKLKDDHRELKNTSSDAAELQKQIQNHIKDKTKMLNDTEKLQADFDAYKKDATKKDLKLAAQTALTDLVKPGALATALKLISLDGIELDEKGAVKADSLTAAVDALKLSDGVLFKGEGDSSGLTTPAVKRAADKVTSSAYETEIAAAVAAGDQKLLDAVVAKYQTQF